MESVDHKPKFHLLTPLSERAGPFDPNAAVFHKGLYHLFYIYSNGWGHSVSEDLVRWTRLPDALVPESEKAIYSGNLFFTDKGPAIAYHVYPLGNGFAYSDDKLVQWVKDVRNPLYTDEGDVHAWDPFVWSEGDVSYGIFGGNTPFLLRGPSHDALKVVGEFIEDDPSREPDEDYSCPDFFQMGDVHVFATMSHSRGTRLYVGKWDGLVFRPSGMLRLNWPGGGFLAPETLLAPDGRRILFGWTQDPRGDEMQGVISLPRVIFLNPDGSLGVRPAKELETLRRERLPYPLSGSTVEIDVEFEPSESPVGLVVRKSPDGEEQTEIIYDGQTLRINSEKSSLDKTTLPRKWGRLGPPFGEGLDPLEHVMEQVAPLALGDEPLRLRVFVDHSILEVFANDRIAMTHRVFPTLADADGIEVAGTPSRIVAYEMRL